MVQVPETALPFPVLDCALVGLGFDEIDELAFDFVFCAKFESFHLLNDLAVEFVGAERFTVNHVNSRRAGETPNHPGMAHHLGESSAMSRVGNKHS